MYLVTGGCGFIGKSIAKRLLESGEKVRVLDIDIKPFEGVEFFEGDIRDRNLVKDGVKGVEYIIHCAAISSVADSIRDPAESHQTNLTGTVNLLIAARDYGIKRFIFASSAAVYGDTPSLPKKERDLPSPNSPYAVEKLCCEAYCRLFSELYGLSTLSLRCFNVYGPGQSPDSQYSGVITRFIYALIEGKNPVIYGTGEQTRDFVYIDDVVDAYILAAKEGEGRGEVYNIGSGRETSINQLFRRLRDITKRDVEPVYQPERRGDIKRSFADISLAEKELGYKPIVDLREGLERTLLWMQRG
jgi:nucleoside-diphosphate-sugar epimerase